MDNNSKKRKSKKSKDKKDLKRSRKPIENSNLESDTESGISPDKRPELVTSKDDLTEKSNALPVNQSVNQLNQIQTNIDTALGDIEPNSETSNSLSDLLKDVLKQELQKLLKTSIDSEKSSVFDLSTKVNELEPVQKKDGCGPQTNKNDGSVDKTIVSSSEQNNEKPVDSGIGDWYTPPTDSESNNDSQNRDSYNRGTYRGRGDRSWVSGYGRPWYRGRGRGRGHYGYSFRERSFDNRKETEPQNATHSNSGGYSTSGINREGKGFPISNVNDNYQKCVKVVHNEFVFDTRIRQVIHSCMTSLVQQLSKSGKIQMSFRAGKSQKTLMVVSTEESINSKFLQLFAHYRDNYDVPIEYEGRDDEWFALMDTFENLSGRSYCFFCYATNHNESNCSKCRFCFKSHHLPKSCKHLHKFARNLVKYRWVFPKPPQIVNPLTNYKNRCTKSKSFKKHGFSTNTRRPCVTKDYLINHIFPYDREKLGKFVECSIDVEMGTGMDKSKHLATQVVLKQYINSNIGCQTIFAAHISDNLEKVFRLNMQFAEQNLPNRIRQGIPLVTVRRIILEKLRNSILYTHSGFNDLSSLGISDNDLREIGCIHVDITSLIDSQNSEKPSLKDLVLFLFGDRIQEYEFIFLYSSKFKTPHKCEVDARFTLKCGRKLIKHKRNGIIHNTQAIRREVKKLIETQQLKELPREYLKTFNGTKCNEISVQNREYNPLSVNPNETNVVPSGDSGINFLPQSQIQYSTQTPNIVPHYSMPYSMSYPNFQTNPQLTSVHSMIPQNQPQQITNFPQNNGFMSANSLLAHQQSGQLLSPHPINPYSVNPFQAVNQFNPNFVPNFVPNFGQQFYPKNN